MMTINLQLKPETRIASAPTVLPPFHVDYGECVSIHHTVSIDSNCRIVDTPVANVVIRKYCIIGPNVTISSAGPPPSQLIEERLERGEREMTGSSIDIGERVWIGASAVIGPGVTIGNGATIAAGAVVLDDMPPNSKVRGNPATFVSEEFHKTEPAKREDHPSPSILTLEKKVEHIDEDDYDPYYWSF